MFRIYTITILVLVCFLAAGQGVGDFANLSGDVGRYDEKTYHDFMRAAREDGDSTKATISVALYGRFLTHQQRYTDAERQLIHALDNIQKMRADLRPTVPIASISVYDVYDYLGDFYTTTANYKNAEFFFKESEKIRTREFSRGSVHRIFNIQNLAQFYINTEQNTLAEVYLEKLIRELNRTRFNSQKLKQAYAIYYKGMTEVSIRAGRLEEAEKFLKKTFVFYGSAFASFDKMIRRLYGNPETLLLRSRVLMMKGETDQAFRILDAAVTPAADSLNFLPQFLRYKAICLFELGKTEEALATAAQMLQVNLDNLEKVFPSLSENEKEEFNRRVSYDFNLFNSLVISASRLKALDNKTLETLINFRLQSKALLLNNSRKIRQAIFASGDSSLVNDFRLLSQLKNRASVEVFRKKSKEEMRDVNQQIATLEKTVNHRVAKFSQRISKPVTLSDIQRQLKSGECAIEIIQTKNFTRSSNGKAKMFALSDSTSYLVALVFSDRLDYTVISNGNELETRMVKFFKNSVNIVGTDSILYSAFWKPFADKLRSTPDIYFSADGAYNVINLNLLRNARGYLLDQYQIILLSNLKDIVADRNSYAGKKGTFVGHPQYELGEELVATKSQQAVTRALRAATLEDLKREEFDDLPGTEDEVQQGAAILNDNGWRVEKITGPAADESRVKKTQNPTLLHLATHGFFIEEGWGIDPMLRSGLIFSGVKNQDAVNNEDGILTAYEASSLTLDSTKLVVLSACETGTGEVKSGEGVYGLQRAFMIAGADNIMMSLWKVDDTATQKLMSYFYAGLVKSSNARLAFTEAQRALRKEYPEPRFWGAFVLLGM